MKTELAHPGRRGPASPARTPRRGGWRVCLCLSAAALAAAGGCRSYNHYGETIGQDTTWVDRVVANVDAGTPPGPIDDPLIQPATLRTIEQYGEPEYWDVTLDEVIAHAMANSQVLRDLGGTLLTAPQIVGTQYMRPLAQTDPRFGMEAALSAFDAQLDILAAYQDNTRVFNNRFLGGGANFFAQDRHDYIAEISKYTATGSQVALRNITDYDNNNAPGNIFGNAWQTQWEGEMRQPLLRGAGVSYNRIAGPGGSPGVYNGVLIAKVNTDMTSAEFNLQVRNYLSDVINAYWDLYYSYRDLDSKQLALERARSIWQAYEAEKAADRKGGVAEALSREQFFRFQADLEDAIAGRVTQRTQNRNGATGGAFRGVNGVQAAERRLRFLIGFPVNDVRILRPCDDPELAPVVFDWTSMAGEAVARRPELQRQRLLVRRREMELIAARNFTQPQLDMYGKYRLRGLGHDLAGNERRDGLRSAYGELLSGEYQEWEVGVQFNMPFGFRQGHAAVQNAELHLARDRAVLREQERQVLHDLSNMVAEVDRAWKLCQTNLNRYLAAKDAVEALDANREAGLPVNLEQVLDAQRRLTEAQSQYYLARSEYALAIKNVHLEKGSLFEYSSVRIAEETRPAADSRPAVAPAPAPAADGPVSEPNHPKFDAVPMTPPDETVSAPLLPGIDTSASSPGGGRTRLNLFAPETLTTAPLETPDAPPARPMPATGHGARPVEAFIPDVPGGIAPAPPPPDLHPASNLLEPAPFPTSTQLQERGQGSQPSLGAVTRGLRF